MKEGNSCFSINLIKNLEIIKVHTIKKTKNMKQHCNENYVYSISSYIIELGNL